MSGRLDQGLWLSLRWPLNRFWMTGEEAAGPVACGRVRSARWSNLCWFCSVSAKREGPGALMWQRVLRKAGHPVPAALGRARGLWNCKW